MSVRPASTAAQMVHESRKEVDLHGKFEELVGQDIDSQVQFFMKSFIFALGDEYKAVARLGDAFKRYLDAENETHDLSAIQAADFLQKNGKTRTAMQRKEELKDIDLDKNDRICFIEYCLLHFKMMILNEYYKRHNKNPPHAADEDGVGLTGVGAQLLEELFTMPAGLDPHIEQAIEQFMEQKKAKESMVKSLESKAEKGGVRGLAAKNELLQMEAADNTENNRLEITLNAAKRRASKTSADFALKAKQKEEEEKKQATRRASRAALAARASMFEKNTAVN